jgi:hypothetical protein
MGVDTLWYRCPECRDYMIIPPTPDERIQAAATWLRFAQGDQESDTPPTAIPPADEKVFNIYFWRF